MRTRGGGLLRAELQEDGLLKWTRKFLVLNTASVSVESSGNEPRKGGIREPGRQHWCDTFWALVTDNGARTERAAQEEVLVWQGRWSWRFWQDIQCQDSWEISSGQWDNNGVKTFTHQGSRRGESIRKKSAVKNCTVANKYRAGE